MQSPPAPFLDPAGMSFQPRSSPLFMVQTMCLHIFTNSDPCTGWAIDHIQIPIEKEEILLEVYVFVLTIHYGIPPLKP